MADHTSSNSTIHSSEQWQAMMNKLLSGQFCFAQEENGRVVEISYEEDLVLRSGNETTSGREKQYTNFALHH